MGTPRPTPEHALLAAFAGTWEGGETLYTARFPPQVSAARGRFVSRMTCDGFFRVTDYEQSEGGVVTYRGHGVYGWDVGTRTYTMSWFDSMGGFCAEVVRGRLVGDTLVFEGSSPRGGARFTYRLHGPDEFSLAIDHAADGDTWTPFLAGRYRRVG